MKLFCRWILLWILCAVPTVLTAQEIVVTSSPTPSVTAVPTASHSLLLDEVVISSDRLPTPKDQVAGSISVLTSKDLQNKQQSTVAEVLRQLPGVDVSQSGGSGKSTMISLRGMGSYRTLVFVDGVEVNDPLGSGGSGAFDFANLTIDNIERIEVLRGSQSALYGPNATGGVVQIFTRKGQGPLKAVLTGELGSFGFERSALGVSGGKSLLDYSVQVSQESGTGFSSEPADPHQVLPLEKDGTKKTVVSSQFGSSPVSFLSLRLIQRYTEAQTSIDDGPSVYSIPDDPNHLNQSRDSLLKGEVESRFLDGRWVQTISLSQELHRYSDLNEPDADHPFDSDFAQYHYNSRRQQVGWQNQVRVLSGHVFSLGFDNSQEWGNESDLSYDWNQYMVLPHVLGQKTDRVNGWYLQDQASWGQRLFLSSGARWDRHDLYGGRASWRLAPAYLVPSLNTKLKATAGTGWTTPTLYQRFDPLSGNASLLPERSLSCDVGFEQPFMGNRLRLEAVYFNNHIQNCIGFDSTLVTAQTPWGEFSNTNRVHSRGCESTLTAQYFKDGAFHLGYSYTDSKNEDTHTQLANVAQNRASFSLDTPSFHNAHAGFEMLYTGKRLYSSQITLPDYTLARLRVEWKPSGRITLFGRIENLFDRRYQEVYGYQTSPRAYYAGSTLQL